MKMKTLGIECKLLAVQLWRSDRQLAKPSTCLGRSLFSLGCPLTFLGTRGHLGRRATAVRTGMSSRGKMEARGPLFPKPITIAPTRFKRFPWRQKH